MNRLSGRNFYKKKRSLAEIQEFKNSMHSPTFSAQLNTASSSFSYFQDTAFSESGASGLAVSREVVEAAKILCAMRADEITENFLQRPTMPFHNPFDDSRLGKRSVVIVDGCTEEALTFDLTVRRKFQNNDHPSKYITDNERFSIQSSLDSGKSTSQSSSVVENNLHQPVKSSDQECVDTLLKSTALKSTAPIATTIPQPGSLQLQQHAFLAVRGFGTEHPAFHSQYQTRTSARCEIDSSGDLAHAEVEPSYESCLLPIERQRKRHKDPAYAERNRERQRKRRKDPAYAERNRKRQRERRKDPAYVERERKLKRERYQNDPAFAERQRERQRERRKKLCENPAYIERERKRLRERYKNDPDYAERLRKRQRERHRERNKNDPDYAERQRKRQRERQRERRKKLCEDPA
ncbi:hypothetical protein [Endozoicomonas acroporae]|uniref:hypothetical protein n=1 Tax=Endozoicomonas acroporae TaxID=1701104 RepID=UPI0019D62D30|nr:hypothetical protein [Endozoicomonas acroporae]